MNIDYYPVDKVPEDVLAFWRTAVERLDPVSRFAGGPEWFGMMAEKSEPPAVVAVARDRSMIKGVFPLLPRIWGKKLQVLKAGGGDLLAENMSDDELHDLISRVLAKYGTIDAIWFDHIGADDRLYLLKSACRIDRSTFIHAIYARMPHYRLRLPAAFEECADMRSAKTRKKIERRERALSRQMGDKCRVIEIRSPDECTRYADAVEGMMNDTWQANSLGHRFRAKNILRVSEKGWLRSFLLTAGNRPAAFVLGYQGFGTFIYEQIGFEREFAGHSPGTILLYRLLDRLYASDTPLYVDFGVGEADYKDQWSNDVIRASSILVVKNRPALALILSLRRLYTALSLRLRMVIDVLGLRNRLRDVYRHGLFHVKR